MIDTHTRFRLSLAVILRSDLEVSDQQHEFQVFKFLFRLVMGICTCFRMGTDLHPLTRNERCPPLPTPWVDNAGVRRRECRDGQGGWMKYYSRTPHHNKHQQESSVGFRDYPMSRSVVSCMNPRSSASPPYVGEKVRRLLLSSNLFTGNHVSQIRIRLIRDFHA